MAEKAFYREIDVRGGHVWQYLEKEEKESIEVAMNMVEAALVE